MLLKSLTLINFGLFRGEQTVPLHTEVPSTHTPIILFGGLNGAGKTTILTAIRLAIYGKQAIPNNVSTKVYEEFLASKIHRDVRSSESAESAGVVIDFTYYKLGREVSYKVCRSWEVIKGKLQETLVLLQDNLPIPEFSQEQCQAFLNELVPLGVSELFFFDGEKIASLADEGGDVALRDAIKKLLGLDIVDRLQNDLLIYIKRHSYSTLPSENKKLLEGIEAEYQSLKTHIAKEELNAQHIAAVISEEKNKLARYENTLASKGGAWAISKELLTDQLLEFSVEKHNIENDIREFLNSSYPLSFAPKLLRVIQGQLFSEHKLKEWQAVSSVLNQRISLLHNVFDKHIPEAQKADALVDVNSIFLDLLSRPSELAETKIIHDLSNKSYDLIKHSIDEILSFNSVYGVGLFKKLESIEAAMENISLQLQRAPDQDSIKEEFEAIKDKSRLLAQLNVKRNMHLEQARVLTWKAIELIKKIKKIEQNFSEINDQSKQLNFANKTRSLLSDFSEEITKRKLQKLEQVFAQTFSRLMRKRNTAFKATIDPKTFEVDLLNEGGGVSISKKDFSAGEKQIYAIAMLEALAITSGRRLPIIIDTPLGRLDSHHRQNLVHHYFPSASHQVIILSTDTEINNGFYDDLSNYIGKSYRIEYDESEAFSTIKSDYFWPKKNERTQQSVS
jgi:DNA sulfur modification protein DndD